MHPDTENANNGVWDLKNKIYSPIKTKVRVPSRNPLDNPTRTSLKISLRLSFGRMDSLVRTRMVTPKDCVPTFPDISDWKDTTMVSWAITGSNIPTTVETPSARKSRITSHGIRLRMLSRRGSFKSSSSLRPASFA